VHDHQKDRARKDDICDTDTRHPLRAIMRILSEASMRHVFAVVATIVTIAGCKPEGGSSSTSAKHEATGTAATTATARASASASAGASATATAAATASAQHGGQVVAVGDHSVELKLYERGLAEAWVLDAKGTPIADEKAKLSLRPSGGAGAGVDLALDPASAMFVGRAAPDAKLPSGAMDIELAFAGGKSANGKLEAPVLLAGPEIGGTLVVAGKYGVELAVGADGTIEARVFDAAGARVDGKVKLALKLPDKAGKLHAVALAWDEVAARFSGKVGAGVELVAGAAEILIDGAVAAKVPSLALRAAAKHDGKLVAVGDYTLELVADAGAITAYAFDASAAAHAAGDLDVALKLGAGAFTKLAWDAPSLAYKAKIDGDVDLGAELALVVKAGGKVFVGASAPSAKASADVDPKVSAKAKAKADVKLPKPEVKVDKGASAGKGKAKAKAKVSVGF
jgi:hypothetical protein